MKEDMIIYTFGSQTIRDTMLNLGGNLRDFENPWGKEKISLQANLCPEDAQIKKECREIVLALHDLGHKDAKVDKFTHDFIRMKVPGKDGDNLHKVHLKEAKKILAELKKMK
ncbi:MAG: hypothetical protein GY858_00470 [Candidatus Omnitrophica bacterium]|nr:hypothetical protein [Candidatus Omnitrophota bacterium]